MISIYPSPRRSTAPTFINPNSGGIGGSLSEGQVGNATLREQLIVQDVE
ncbi:MAG TPA: hypothetical protein VJN67_12120 [Stellaceae bacterium]|nr:hypothetical protein [Stellaceae bacterium]